MNIKFILTGHYAGKNVKFNHCQFEGGVFVAKGDPTKLGGLVNYLASFNAYPEGSAELKAAQARDAETKEGSDGADTNLESGRTPEGGVQTNQSTPGTSGGSEPTGGSGNPEGNGTSKTDGVSAGREGGSENPLLIAVKSLDAAVDTNWTAAGLPTVEAVAAAAGLANVTRKEIEAVAPGYTREKALEALV